VCAGDEQFTDTKQPFIYKKLDSSHSYLHTSSLSCIVILLRVKTLICSPLSGPLIISSIYPKENAIALTNIQNFSALTISLHISSSSYTYAPASLPHLRVLLICVYPNPPCISFRSFSNALAAESSVAFMYPLPLLTSLAV
jgi:hypothetical protein